MGPDAGVTRAARKVSTHDDKPERASDPSRAEKPVVSSVLAARAEQELEDRRLGLLRFFRMAVVGWSAFVIADFAVVYLNPGANSWLGPSHTAQLAFLVVLRAAGTGLGLLGYAALTSPKGGARSHDSLTALEGSLTVA